jgi:hypothetical protein
MLAKQKASGVGILVHDPLDDDWPSDWQTDDIEEFIDVAMQNRDCILLIDEAGEVISHAQAQKHPKRRWLATRARHNGHKSIFIAQRAPMLSPTIVRNCTEGFIFRQHARDLKGLEEVMTNEHVMKAKDLGRGECVWVDNFGNHKFINVFGRKSDA